MTNLVLSANKGVVERSMAMLWLTSYPYLLRLPSEVCYAFRGNPAVGLVCLVQALPMCRCDPDSLGASKEQSIIWFDGTAVCLRLLRRKNRPQGSGTLRRVCSCKGCVQTCAVHTLWEGFLAGLPAGTHPWSGLAPGTARDKLRAGLVSLGVPNAGLYGTHDLRRGHAEACCLLLYGLHLYVVAACCAGYETLRLHAG